MKALFILILASIGSIVSGIIAALYGGWSQPMTVLLIMIGLDYITGLIVAFGGNSPHTTNGGLSSAVGLKGLLRKFIMIIVVAAAYQLDKLIGTSYIRDAVAIAFIANEALSLIENAGLMGVPIPNILLKGIEVLKGKADQHTDELTENHSDKPPDEDPDDEEDGEGDE
jgi:toxin secretion/phage lysis holin